MRGILAFLYGLIAYAMFLGTFLYAVGFVTNRVVPKSIDHGGEIGSLITALVIDAALLGLFAVQHSGMARPGFKRVWTKIVPHSIERTTYVVVANLTLILLFVAWRPLPETVWHVADPGGRAVLWGICALGWVVAVGSTFMISHVHLFGLLQVWQRLRGKPLSDPVFQTRALYRYCRHPLMLGFLLAFWATPDMTLGHLLFAVATTGYILVALQLEERDLLVHIGYAYQRYQEQVPMLIPRPWRRIPAGDRRAAARR